MKRLTDGKRKAIEGEVLAPGTPVPGDGGFYGRSRVKVYTSAEEVERDFGPSHPNCRCAAEPVWGTSRVEQVYDKLLALENMKK